MIKQIKDKIMLAAMAIPVYAQSDAQKEEQAQKEALAGNGPALSTNFSGIKELSVQTLLGNAIRYLMIITSIIFFFIFVYGGIKWITSGGDEKKVAAARSSVTHALIGLGVVFSAWAIMALIKSIFQVDLLNNLSLPKAY